MRVLGLGGESACAGPQTGSTVLLLRAAPGGCQAEDPGETLLRRESAPRQGEARASRPRRQTVAARRDGQAPQLPGQARHRPALTENLTQTDRGVRTQRAPRDFAATT